LPKESFAIGALSDNGPPPDMKKGDFLQRLMERCFQQNTIMAHRRQEVRDEPGIPAVVRRSRRPMQVERQQ
jgi:hypothetical protein